MKRFLIILFIICLALPVCAKKRQSEEVITPLTKLEKREFQTRVYSLDDKNTVMKAFLNVFQDEGFIIYNANPVIGFVYSVKDFDTADKNIDISKEFGLSKSRLNYNGVTVATLEATTNITQYGNNVRARVNFKRKLLNQYGNAQFISNIEEAEYYNEFFSKVERDLNLQKQSMTNVQKEEKPVANITETEKTEEEIKTETIKQDEIKSEHPEKVEIEQKETELSEEKTPAQQEHNNKAEITDINSTENVDNIEKSTDEASNANDNDFKDESVLEEETD